MHQITFPPSFSGWQRAARRALHEEISPGEIFWQELGSDQPLLDLAEEQEGPLYAQSGLISPRPGWSKNIRATPHPPLFSSAEGTSRIKVPKSFVEAAYRVACHSDPDRWGLLYHILWRLTHGEHELMQIMVDPDIHQLRGMEKAIRHDVHKMRAFVRFREVKHEGASWYVAWFEPAHHIVELNAPFFVDRFASMCWSILTPDRSVHWDGANLSFTEGVPRSEAPTEDAAESLWIRYYSNIFNPARVKVHAMQAEMPKKYWKNLPEAAVIPALLREAPTRVGSMMAKSRAKTPSADEFHPAPVPDTDDLEIVHAAAMKCTACPLYRGATQTVFGEGSRNAKIVLLGEQPGDSEDKEGHPFIGPAGKLLDRALEEAGVDRKVAYVTNSVKHFKWVPSGKRRLHRSPSPREIAACRPWLEAEMAIIKPQVLVCLGSTAARTVLGPDVRVLRDRGQFTLSEFSAQTFITIHPSSLLRAPDEETREREYAKFVAELRLVAERLK